MSVDCYVLVGGFLDQLRGNCIPVVARWTQSRIEQSILLLGQVWREINLLTLSCFLLCTSLFELFFRIVFISGNVCVVGKRKAPPYFPTQVIVKCTVHMQKT